MSFFCTFAADFDEICMIKRVFTILIFCVCAYAYAQDAPKQADLQTTPNNQFFDPTKQEVKENDYTFGVKYRFEVGYIQNWQHSLRKNYADMYLHGGRLGVTFDFLLPYRLSMQTGILLDMAFGVNNQHWRSQDAPSVQVEYLRHRILEVELTVPIQCYYTIPLWKKLNMFFFTGPQFSLGLAEYDMMQEHLSDGTEAWLKQEGYHTTPYDRLADKELHRFNVQWTLGGGFEWDIYRLQAGYEFGLNNMVRHKVIENQHMWQWGWFVTFCYKFK